MKKLCLLSIFIFFMTNAAGGHLATVTSYEENNFVASLMSSVDQDVKKYWLGGYQPEVESKANGYSASDNWSWVTGETWSYSNWYLGEPNNGVGERNIICITGRPLVNGMIWRMVVT